MYRFVIKCGEETDREQFKINNKKPYDGLTKFCYLDSIVKSLLNSLIKFSDAFYGFTEIRGMAV